MKASLQAGVGAGRKSEAERRRAIDLMGVVDLGGTEKRLAARAAKAARS